MADYPALYTPWRIVDEKTNHGRNHVNVVNAEGELIARHVNYADGDGCFSPRLLPIIVEAVSNYQRLLDQVAEYEAIFHDIIHDGGIEQGHGEERCAIAGILLAKITLCRQKAARERRKAAPSFLHDDDIFWNRVADNIQEILDEIKSRVTGTVLPLPPDRLRAAILAAINAITPFDKTNCPDPSPSAPAGRAVRILREAISLPCPCIILAEEREA